MARGRSSGLRPELLEGLGVAQDGVEQRADGVVGGVGAGRKDGPNKGQRFVIGQALPFHLGGGQRREQIRNRVGPALGEDGTEEDVEPGRGLERLGRHEGEGDEGHSPFTKDHLVLHRQTEELGDHRKREALGEVGDEISAPGGHEAVDELMTERAQDRFDVGRDSRPPERRRHQGFVDPVLVAFHPHQVAPHHREAVGLVEGAGRKMLLVAEHGEDVVVVGDEPGGLAGEADGSDATRLPQLAEQLVETRNLDVLGRQEGKVDLGGLHAHRARS